ncbi:MAG: hypothetical protein ABIJ22_02555 [Patescibacteria group bacterium]
MSDIFSTPEFKYPYTDYRFPGQSNDEIILFVGRENSTILWWHRSLVILVSALLFSTVAWVSGSLQKNFGIKIPAIIPTVTFFIAICVAGFGWWWASALWKKSIGVITNRRLTKFIFTTPFNRHNFSLPLDMVVDTGAYRKGFKQAIFQLETFTARSSASSSGVATDNPNRVNKKYFYLENIKMAEDLQHYVNKLLYAFRHHQEHLATFRPFIPKKSGNREELIDKHPDYWS